MFDNDENTSDKGQTLQENISEITNVEVFDGNSLSSILTNLYKNILEDREITKQTVKDISELIKGNGDGESYLKLKEIELLQDSNDQLMKIADLMKNLLVAKSAPKPTTITGLILGEEERLQLTSGEGEDSNDNEGEIILENIDKTNYEEIEEETEEFNEEFPSDEEIEDGETADEEESAEYDELIESLEKE
jgi:hypothetical protein